MRPGKGGQRLKARPRRGGAARSRLHRIRGELIQAARTRTKVTYGSLMRHHHLSRGRSLSSAIGELDREENSRGAPGFAALIVRKDTGYPGGGYFCDEGLPVRLRRPRDRGNDPRLTPAEKDHIIRQQEKIWAFYRGRH